MRSTIPCLLMTTLLMLPGAAPAAAGDWLTLPSHYTHDPATGLRVSQYAAAAVPTAPMATDFRSGGYTHTRSSLNYGQSADNYHRVEQWGPPVQPYGEWRFPFRPYSVPYSQWGAPFAGLGGFGGRGWGHGWGGPGGGGGGHGGGGHEQPPSNGQNPYPNQPGSAYPDAPYYDGYHPTYRD